MMMMMTMMMTMMMYDDTLSVCDVSQYPNASKLDQCWIANDWLYSIGLSQYSGVFETQLVDGRVLNVLSKKDLDKHLNIHNKFHQSSILHAVQLLRMMRFDIQVTSTYVILVLCLSLELKIFIN